MSPKVFINLFFIWLVVLLLLLSPIALPLQSKADEATSVSHVLGRTKPLYVLWDDFEDPDWSYNPQTEEFANKLWRGGSSRGVPELLERVPTPNGGKKGSTGALEIRTNEIEIYRDGHLGQEDLLTAEYEQKLGRKLTRADQPVFIVRVWLPPFDQWGDYYSFGFRHESFLENGSKDQHYSTIWLTYDRGINPKPFFKYRVGTNELFYEVYDPRLIEKDGWWTIAVAFDENGFCHYYARPGAGDLTEEDRLFDATQLFPEVYDPRLIEQDGWLTIVNARKIYAGIGAPTSKGEIAGITITSLLTKCGKDALLMNYINYSFFTLGYSPDGNATPPFVIDDYEVWVVKSPKTAHRKAGK